MIIDLQRDLFSCDWPDCTNEFVATGFDGTRPRDPYYVYCSEHLQEYMASRIGQRLYGPDAPPEIAGPVPQHHAAPLQIVPIGTEAESEAEAEAEE